MVNPDQAEEAEWTPIHAARLLASLDQLAMPSGWTADHPAVSWARSGLSAVTGHPDGDALAPPVALSAAADAALAALRALAHSGGLDPILGSALLGARSRLLGLSRRGSASPGGACRLLPTADGMLAVNLPRESDWELAHAWLENEQVRSWRDVALSLALKPTDASLERARLLGLAVAPADAPLQAPTDWFETISTGARRSPSLEAGPLVVDLSSLWAGPLCADLLGRLGGRVIKVESIRRPDGAREGNADFYAQLNGAKSCLALDFSSDEDLTALVRLIRSADIVIESARPRALAQLGIQAEALVNETSGLSWIAISAYGRSEPNANWIGFGDDCGAAAGLSALLHEVSGDWFICGDAIADPLTGVHAALLAWSSWMKGGGVLQSIALRDVAAFAAASDACASPALRRERWRRWNTIVTASSESAYVLPPARGPAQTVGESNHLLNAFHKA